MIGKAGNIILLEKLGPYPARKSKPTIIFGWA
jgi:hypothetical protein